MALNQGGILMDTLIRRISHYSRTRYRVPASLAAVFLSTNSAAIGRVTNMSVTGCLIHCPMKLEAGSQVAIRLRLVDQQEFLNIESAIVRWTDGSRHGVEFHTLSALTRQRLYRSLFDQVTISLQATAERA